MRTDRLNLTGDILSMIQGGLRNCDCAVAVLDDLRPNVLYEVGIAHTLEKPTLFIMQEDGKIPFDVDKHATLRYRSVGTGLQKKIEEQLDQVRKMHVPGRSLVFKESKQVAKSRTRQLL